MRGPKLKLVVHFNDCYIEILLPVSISTYCHRHVVLDPSIKMLFSSKLMTSYRFFKMAAIQLQIYLRVSV